MNENAILAETVVNGYLISTYDDGVMWQTMVLRNVIPPDGRVWEMGRSFSEEDARGLHKKIVSEIIKGMTPEAGT